MRYCNERPFLDTGGPHAALLLQGMQVLLCRVSQRSQIMQMPKMGLVYVTHACILLVAISVLVSAPLAGVCTTWMCTRNIH
jgi:hypothetical protein